MAHSLLTVGVYLGFWVTAWLRPRWRSPVDVTARTGAEFLLWRHPLPSHSCSDTNSLFLTCCCYSLTSTVPLRFLSGLPIFFLINCPTVELYRLLLGFVSFFFSLGTATLHWKSTCPIAAIKRYLLGIIEDNQSYFCFLDLWTLLIVSFALHLFSFQFKTWTSKNSFAQEKHLLLPLICNYGNLYNQSRY